MKTTMKLITTLAVSFFLMGTANALPHVKEHPGDANFKLKGDTHYYNKIVKKARLDSLHEKGKVHNPDLW